MKMSEGVGIQNHFLDFDKLLRNLQASGAKIDAQDALLLTLPSSYDALITALDSVETGRLTLEFVRTSGSSESAFVSKKWNFKCYNCGKIGHRRSECKEKPKAKARRMSVWKQTSRGIGHA